MNSFDLVFLLKGLRDHTLRITALTIYWAVTGDQRCWTWDETQLCLWRPVTLDQSPHLSQRQFSHLHNVPYLYLRGLM